MTAAQRARVHPFRGDSVPLPDADLGAQRVAAYWQMSSFRDPTRTNLDHWKPAADDRTRAAIAAFEDNGPATEPDVEAAMLAMLDYTHRRGIIMKGAEGGDNDRYFPIDAWFVRRWLAAGGVPFALRVLARFAGTAWPCLEIGHLGIVQVLRKAIATADGYADGVAEAAKLREHAPIWLRTAIAFAFPDEPFWERDLEETTPKRKTGKFGPAAWALVTTRIPQAAIPPLLDSMAKGDKAPFMTDTPYYLYTLVHRFGDAAMKHVDAYLAAVKNAWAKEQAREVRSCVKNT